MALGEDRLMKTGKKSVVYACLAVISWSTVATAFKVALSYLSHFEMLWVACLTSGAIFAVLLTFQRKWSLVFRLSGKQWGYLAFMGLLNPVAYYLVLFMAYELLPAQVAQPINYAWPIVLLVLLALFAGQPIPPKKYIGMVVSLGGVALISLGSGISTVFPCGPQVSFTAPFNGILTVSVPTVSHRLSSYLPALTGRVLTVTRIRHFSPAPSVSGISALTAGDFRIHPRASAVSALLYTVNSLIELSPLSYSLIPTVPTSARSPGSSRNG